MSGGLWVGPALERIEELDCGFAERASAERTDRLAATVREANGLVELTVGSNGQVTGLRLDEGIRWQPASTTVPQIMAAIRAARSDLVQQFGEVTAETVGADGATGLATRLATSEGEAPM